MSAEFHLVDFALVLTKTEKFGAHISSVPNCDASISAARNHQVLVERRVVDGHYLVDVCINHLDRLVLSHIPDFEFLVITDRRKLVFIVMVPADIFNHRRVGVVQSKHGIDSVRQLILVVHIPNADAIVIAAWKKQTSSLRVPIETVTFTVMTKEDHFRFDLVCSGARSMLKVVEDVNFTWDGLSRDNFVHLRHVSGAIHFTLVVYLKLNLNAFILG
jgi:hypothetical protein